MLTTSRFLNKICPPEIRPRFGDQVEDGQRRHRFATARLSDDPERLAWLEVEADPIDSTNGSRRGTELSCEVLDLEQGAGYRRILGSIASRQPVPYPVEGEDCEGQGKARSEHDVWRDLDRLIALDCHAAPTRRWGRDAHAQQAEEGLEYDRRGHQVCGLDDDRPERVGQDVPGQNFEVGGPDGAGRLYKLTLAESQRLSADQPSHPQPGRDRDREDDVLNAAPDQHHQDQGDEQVGHAVGDVDQRRYDHVDLASVEARQQAENNPDD